VITNNVAHLRNRIDTLAQSMTILLCYFHSYYRFKKFWFLEIAIILIQC